MPYVIAEPCVGVKNGACVEVCPVECIHTTPDASQHYIDPEVCIECEQCVIVCPVDAVFLDSELPDEWKRYTEVNAQFFRERGEGPTPIPTDRAMKMVQAAHAYAARLNIQITAVVVDDTGRVIHQGRMQGAAEATIEAATTRAYTAAIFQVATDELTHGMREALSRDLTDVDAGRVVCGQGGGFPVLDGVKVVGGMGVSGGTDEQDRQCCQAGLGV